MRKRKIIIGNWKMNPESAKLAETLYKNIIKGKFSAQNTDVVICPPYVFLGRLKKISKKIQLGVQNISKEERGPFTGEISAEMAYDVGARYAILGHSERRTMGETDRDVNKKIKLALSAGLVPILCVGESSREGGHEYFSIIKKQISECMTGVNKNSVSKTIIAYEPVWALSSTANRHDFAPPEFLEIKIFIKKVLSDMFGAKTELPRIIYGGSVRPDNALEFLRDGQADGLLPGKDSLDPKKFLEIIKIANSLEKH